MVKTTKQLLTMYRKDPGLIPGGLTSLTASNLNSQSPVAKLRHDISNIAMMIAGSAELLADHLSPHDKEGAKLLACIQEATSALQQRVRRFQAESETQTG